MNVSKFSQAMHVDKTKLTGVVTIRPSTEFAKMTKSALEN